MCRLLYLDNNFDRIIFVVGSGQSLEFSIAPPPFPKRGVEIYTIHFETRWPSNTSLLFFSGSQCFSRFIPLGYDKLSKQQKNEFVNSFRKVKLSSEEILVAELFSSSTSSVVTCPLQVRGCSGAVHILRNTGWGGGLPDLLQYYIGGLLKVYYNITVLKGKWKVIIPFQL